MGVHRLVRISPFDSNARRHTSFASVDVYPEVDDTIKIDIPEKDYELKFIRGSGAGGQKVNKTSSTCAVAPHAHQHRDHLPDRAIAERQQRHGVQDSAGAALRSRDQEARSRDAGAAEAQKMDISFGSQIRSYVMQPYRMVKDLRTGVDSGQPDKVLDGDLDEFITAQLMGVKNPARSLPE